MDELIASLGLEVLDRDLFRSKVLWTPQHARGTFGGQIIAHCVEAATKTIPADLSVHSMHSNFLMAGNSSQPMYYRVRRLRDGASFATRYVMASQDGKAVFVSTLSFHKKEKPGIQHQPSMPKTLSPDEALLERDVFADILQQTEIAPSFKENLRRKMPDEKLMAIRYCSRGTLKKPLQSSTPQYAWMKSAKLSGDSNITHVTLAAFMSDFTLALAPLVPHGFPNVNTRMMVSLDHSIYFHAPFRVDEWFLYETWSSWADDNRGLCNGRIWSSDGRLAMTIQQEALIRMKQGYVSVSKL
jgi:acyl-CoA thioesterase II